MEITGNIKAIGNVEQGTSKAGKPFTKVDFVIEETDKYPCSASLTLFGERVNEFLPVLQSGKLLTVKFDIRANEYNGRWYNSLNAWSVAYAEASNEPAQQPTQQYAEQPTPTRVSQSPHPTSPQIDELPF